MKGTEIQPGLWLDSRRAVFFEALGLLAVADLHWGYATEVTKRQETFCRRGATRKSRNSLLSLIADYQPSEMMWLGDSLHDLSGRRPAEEFLRRCSVPVILLPGNHDRKWPVAKEKSVSRGAFFFHHGDTMLEIPPETVEVIGHFHPAFSWYDGAGGRVKLPGLVYGPK